MRAILSLGAAMLVVAGAGFAWSAGLFPKEQDPAYFSSAFVQGAEFQFDPPAPGSYSLPPIKRQAQPSAFALRRSFILSRIALCAASRSSAVILPSLVKPVLWLTMNGWRLPWP